MKLVGLFIASAIAVLLLPSFVGTKVISVGQWKITIDENSDAIRIENNNRFVLNDVKLAYKLADKLVSTHDYSIQRIKKRKEGEVYVVTIVYKSDKYPEVDRNLYIYPDADFFETDFCVRSQNGVSSNYMAPVVLDNVDFINASENNRALFVPFDNDKWVRFQSHPLTFDRLTSYEVTSVFDNASRKGLVVGSVTHDAWKTGITMQAGDNRLASFTCYGGAADELTRDIRPHGFVSGNVIRSPRIFVGFFNDWRIGMETYADANARITPPKAWDKAVPFGWNSWGVLQFRLNYEKAVQASDFFKNNLQNNHFKNGDNTVYVGLDSGWNSFSEQQLKAFVDKCKANGQEAGVYWTPFTDWGKNPDRQIDDAPGFKFKDVYLYANGNPQDLDGAYAIDPTHPAIEMRMRKISELFHRCGFAYVKMDFMTHGALEADHWYAPNITTGIQAYNYGMTLLDKYFGDMFVNLSISPIFPANYAQSRRIACDAWNKIKDTEYTLNALSYGWWIDRVYQFNDADHVVLQQATDGENRARVTSAVITGLFITGDDFSDDGSDEGKEKARKFLTNAAVNDLARGISFRPVEGNGEKSECQFMYQSPTGDTFLALFNYSDSDTIVLIPFGRLGINAGQVKKIVDLWNGENVSVNQSLIVNSKDVKFLKITKLNEKESK